MHLTRKIVFFGPLISIYVSGYSHNERGKSIPRIIDILSLKLLSAVLKVYVEADVVFLIAVGNEDCPAELSRVCPCLSLVVHAIIKAMCGVRFFSRYR